MDWSAAAFSRRPAGPAIEQGRNRFAVKIILSGAVLIACATVDVGVAAAQSDASIFVVPRPLMVVAHRDLSFGTVIPGIISTVSVNAAGAGLFEIQGEPNTAIRIDFDLPTAMTSDGGEQIPMAFGPGDGIATIGSMKTAAIGFDPRTPLITTVGPTGQLQIHLGGTALPNRDQPGGVYRATVSLSVFDLGS